MSVKLFVMTHKKFDVPNNSMYIPMHVGHANAKEDFGYMGDDTGDNISDKNCYYAELSGVYWVWKNYTDADYVGICHYRRYLTNEQGYVFTKEQYEDILHEYDIVTTKQLELPNSYHYGFGAHHRIEILDKTGEIIKERYPRYYDTYVRLVNGNKTYFGNIMVASKQLFDEYASWLFDIFFELEKRISLEFEDDYHKRVFGFISEFLLYVWVTVNKLKAYECRVAIIGEKTETREIKFRMAEFFNKKDVAGAKKYFEKWLKIRPDVLMEASDITGECKLCLQAVSTANLENECIGSNFLDNHNSYQEVIDYFRRINAIVLRAAENKMTDKDKNWLCMEKVSDIAIKAAVRVLLPEGDKSRKTARDMSLCACGCKHIE